MTANHYPEGVSGPVPIWLLSAEHSTERMARAAHRRRSLVSLATLVTRHPAPYAGDPVTASARSTYAAAVRVGMAARLHVGLETSVVEGRVAGQRLGFRATWRRGKADAALWYEPAARYDMIEDPRPAHDATVTRNVKGKPTQVAHPNRMPRGLDRRHLVQVASPTGIVVTFVELSRRIKALG